MREVEEEVERLREQNQNQSSSSGIKGEKSSGSAALEEELKVRKNTHVKRKLKKNWN